MKRIEAPRDQSRLLKNGALALTAIAGMALLGHEIASGAFSSPNAFDYTNDGVFHDPNFPGISNMVLINGNTAESVFNTGAQIGFDQTLGIEAGIIGGTMLGKLAVNLSPFSESTKRSLNSGINFALAAGGAGALLYALHDGGLTHPTARFDLTNDGVFRDPSNPSIANMILINGNTADSVFHAAQQTGIDHALGLTGGALITAEVIRTAPKTARSISGMRRFR